MIIGIGSFELADGDRDAWIDSLREQMEISRGEDGCLEYVFAPDPLDARRVVLVEKWASQEHLDAHMAALQARRSSGSSDGPRPVGASLVMYETAGETKLI